MAVTQAPVDLFWYWINERHRIYLKKTAGEPKPWTSDPILQKFKFTNVFRQLDTGTVWLTENFIKPHWDDRLDLIAFNICWYRMFNWKGTGELLGWQTDWEPLKVRLKLHAALRHGKQVFTGAHIVRSAFGEPKIDSIVDVCSDLFHMCVAGGALVTCCEEEKSLQTVYNGLLQVDYVGPFMAYEMVTDMRHTRLLNDAHDIMTWANAGPGALRGLERLGFGARLTPKQATSAMQELLRESRHSLEPHVPPLEMRDIEHSLCETDKYARVKFGEGKPRGRYNGL